MLSFIRARKKMSSIPAALLYPYDFPTSGYPDVDVVRFQIEDQSEWDFCLNGQDAYVANIEAAALFAFGPDFSIEQQALFDLLLKLKAGPHIMIYAWGLYGDMVYGEGLTH